jgi:hypothetical protein
VLKLRRRGVWPLSIDGEDMKCIQIFGGEVGLTELQARLGSMGCNMYICTGSSFMGAKRICFICLKLTDVNLS